MREKSLGSKLYGKAISKYTKPLCNGKIVISHKDGWRYFNCTENRNEDNNRLNKSIAIKDYGANNRERDKKLKNIVKRILCPECRRSFQISRYVEN